MVWPVVTAHEEGIELLKGIGKRAGKEGRVFLLGLNRNLFKMSSITALDRQDSRRRSLKIRKSRAPLERRPVHVWLAWEVHPAAGPVAFTRLQEGSKTYPFTRVS